MKIRDIRKELCLSQAEFARLLGVHQTAVSQWETGRTSPEMEIAKRIARISGHSLGEVLDEESVPQEEDGIIRLTMNDDGLKGERICQGDTLYLRPQSEYAAYDIVAAETPEGMVVREVVPVGEKRYLFSTILREPIIELTAQVRIIGKVFAFYSPLL